MNRLGRRTFLLAGAGVALAGCGSSADSGDEPRTAVGRQSRAGTIVSDAMGGEAVGYTVNGPIGTPLDGLPVLLSLHGRGGDQGTALKSLRLLDVLDRTVERSGTPFALVTVAGGVHSYYHRRDDGTDAAAMIVEELLPKVAGRGLDTGRLGLHGWSMGGYGALLLAGKLELPVRAVAVSSTALFTTAGATSPGAFDGPQDFAEHDVFGHPEWLRGIPVRIDCGEADPFYDASRQFAERLDPAPETGFGPGDHDAAYWRRVAPAQFRFLAERLA